MKAKIALRFDDGGISSYTTIWPILRARNLRGSFALISSKMGLVTDGYDHIDYTEAGQMMREGATFHNHTKTHQLATLITDTQANCYTEINDCRSALISNGLGDGISEDIFIPPYGEWGTNYQLAIAQANVKMTVGTIGTSGLVPQATSNAILDPQYQVPSCYIVRTTSTAYVNNVIQNAINKNAAKNGVYLILTYHHVVTTPAAVDIERSTANFTTDMDNLAAAIAAGNAECVTLSELWEQFRA